MSEYSMEEQLARLQKIRDYYEKMDPDLTIMFNRCEEQIRENTGYTTGGMELSLMFEYGPMEPLD